MRGHLRASRRRTSLLFLVSAVLAAAGCAHDTTAPAPASDPPAAAVDAPGLPKALAAQARHTERLLAMPNVVGTAVGLTADGRAAVKLFTVTADGAGMPTALDGVPVERVVTGEIRALPATAAAAGRPTMPQTRFTRPVPIGISTGNEGTCSAGTIGARVKAGGKVYALSNNHVYALENLAPLGSRVLQPGRYDLQCASGLDGFLGTLTRFVPIVFSTTANNVADAAIASSSTSLLGRGTPEDGYGIPAAAPVRPVLGLEVQKYGKTSRLTTGRVDAINATVKVTYLTGVARFVGQVLVAGQGPFARAGDSGALIVTRAGRQPVALLFAGTASGYTFANPIDAVLKSLNVTIDGG